MPRLPQRFVRIECPKGHSMTPENRDSGGRCRTCVRGWRGYKGNPVNRSKTHCPDGHPYDGDNLGTYKRGNYTIRYCRTCQRNRSRSYYWKFVKEPFHPGKVGRPKKRVDKVSEL